MVNVSNTNWVRPMCLILGLGYRGRKPVIRWVGAVLLNGKLLMNAEGSGCRDQLMAQPLKHRLTA